MADFIEADQLTKTFPTALGLVPWVRNFGRMERRTVLDRVSFSAHPGEPLGFLGTSGAGKSTILRILAGLIGPDRGAVWVGGIDAPAALRSKVVLCCTDERSFFISLLPLWLQGVSWMVPITHALSGIRGAFRGASLRDLSPDPIWLAVATLVLLPFSLLVFRAAVARAKFDGTLGQY